MRFFKRIIRTGLPTAIEKEVSYNTLMRIKARKQQGAAQKKGRTSTNEFRIGDEVRIQDLNTKTWTKVGKIKEARKADDEQDVSFVIELDNGRETIRHRSHLRHNVTRYTKVIDTKVRFEILEKETKEDKEEKNREETRKKRGRPAEYSEL